MPLLFLYSFFIQLLVDILKKTQKNKNKDKKTTYVAGCGRKQESALGLEHIAYTELEFDDCVGCVHRLEPTPSTSSKASDFCVWWPEERENPFAKLQDLNLDWEVKPTCKNHKRWSMFVEHSETNCKV